MSVEITFRVDITVSVQSDLDDDEQVAVFVRENEAKIMRRLSRGVTLSEYLGHTDDDYAVFTSEVLDARPVSLDVKVVA